MARLPRQTGALPYRLTGDAPEVLLVTSRSRRRWILPKGNPMSGKSLAEAAAEEAYEEAGVRGAIGHEDIGTYRHGVRSKKEVRVFPLRVEEVLEEYPEAHQRQRQWFSFEEARARVWEPELRSLLARAQEMLGQERG